MIKCLINRIDNLLDDVLFFGSDRTFRAADDLWNHPTCQPPVRVYADE